jgi:molecular chaperone GrpE
VTNEDKEAVMNGQVDEMEPEVDESEFEELDIDALITERNDFLDQLKRTMAEFANYRRRIDQEREQMREHASRSILSQMVPVFDDFQRAISSTPEDLIDTPWVQGVLNIERKFAGVLERAGVTPVDALGKPFDPAFHEAVASDPGSSGSHVVEVYQNGYSLGNTLLRPAMVEVGDKPTWLTGTEGTGIPSPSCINCRGSRPNRVKLERNHGC